VEGFAENGIATDLHVAFLEDVEHPHLDQFVEFGQFVHGEDAAVHPRNQPEVERLLARHARAAGQLGRVDLADDVGELRPGSQPLGVAVGTMPPGDRHVLRLPLGHQPAAGGRDRGGGVVVKRNRRIVEIGEMLVEEPHEQPHQPALRLPLLTKEEHVMAGEHGDVDLGDHGVVVADDAGEEFLAAAQKPREVRLQFILDGAALPAARVEFCQGAGKVRLRHRGVFSPGFTPDCRRVDGSDTWAVSMGGWPSGLPFMSVAGGCGAANRVPRG
jgi:hypothetical protein